MARDPLWSGPIVYRTTERNRSVPPNDAIEPPRP